MNRLALTTVTLLATGVLAACGTSGRGSAGDLGRNNNLDGFRGAPLDGSQEQPTDFAGIDLPPAFANVYAHTAKELYTYEASSSTLTPVGAFGVDDEMTDLAVTPDGGVYTISRTSVYSVNSTTGAATLLASGVSQSNVALTFRLDGTLLASDQDGNVYIIDPTTAQTKTLGKFGTDYDTAGDLVAVADGTMFGVSTTAPDLPNATTNVLIKVNTSTAKATTVGEIGYSGVFGIAYTGGRVIAFTKTGQIVEIDPTTGQGTLKDTKSGVVFYGAGTSPLVPIN